MKYIKEQILEKNFLIKSRDISLKNNQISVCGVPDSDIYTGKTSKSFLKSCTLRPPE